MSHKYSAAIHKLRQAADPLEEIIFSNTESFCAKFCKITDVMDLVSVRFSSQSVEFVYVSDEGQHFVDGIDWEELEAWIEEVRVGN